MTLTVGKLLLLAALVLFILAALGLFAIITGWTLETELGMVAAGLACWVAASLT